jgi:hypothetical protein
MVTPQNTCDNVSSDHPAALITHCTHYTKKVTHHYVFVDVPADEYAAQMTYYMYCTKRDAPHYECVMSHQMALLPK